MSAPRTPLGFMSAVLPVHTGPQGSSSENPLVADIQPSSKFAIEWGLESQVPVPLPPAAERPVALSSSEGETDISEEESSVPQKKSQRAEEFDEAEFVTPTNHLNLDENPMERAALPSLPRLSRAFSMPLFSQLGSLQNPRRQSLSSDTRTPVGQATPDNGGGLHELSLELADSVQLVIQTLLQLSPPQLLDPAKEQLSACSLSIPTPSISAMFTAMRSLNYMSANMSALNFDSPSPYPADLPRSSLTSTELKDFDVGEMLQSVGDVLSGIAAQAGVDLVIFHGDVGMKHIAVKGDESGISYALSHIIRQVICVSRSGDTVEVGLYIDTDRDPPHPEASSNGHPASSLETEGVFRCTFHVIHRYSIAEASTSSVSAIPRPQPHYKSLILRRLLRHVGASLEVDVHPVGVAVGHSCKVVVSLSAGEHSVVNPSASLTPEDASYLGLSEFPIAREPTLDQLNQFAESLRGKKVTLYASAKGSFAHHLSSYLTAWGMDVSHISAEGAAEGEDQGEDIAEPPQSSNVDLSTIKPGTASTQPSPPSPNTSLRASPDPISFTLIDDDVNVLRSRLQKLKMDQAYPLHLSVRKRPSLASNHRPRSSPQVARVMGVPQLSAASSSHTVIVHFTSLANFKLVKEAIQSCLLPINGTPMKVPEVIVVPKPAGPRRFLTALHTAVSKPVVDPFFAPIATSPISPGIHSISPFFGLSNAPRSPSGKSTTSARSDRSNRSPKEYGEPPHVSASPMGVTEGLGYFPNTSFRMGSSPSGGLLISSPNGPPAGIFFVPKKSSMGAPPSPLMERDRPQEAEGRSRGTSFRMPPATQEISPGRTDANLTALSTLPEVTRPSPPTGLSMASNGSDSKGKGRATQTPVNEPSPITSNEPSPAIPDALPSSVEPSPQPAPRLSSRRSSQQSASPPVSPTRPVAGTGTRRMSRRAAAAAVDSQPAGLFSVSKKPKGAGDNAIVPPISVLIVDDNPINQTILSTFMKKKKIKYDVAKNGEEAVQKWKSGTFHLILMDIQMPVMDGIEATKEIRRIEKQITGGFPSTPQSEGQRTPSEASTDSRSASTPQYRSSVIIVALTASSLQADRVAALAAGCNDFLTKPVSLQWLNNKIIEWGSIKALQMWADIRPEVVRSFTSGQAAQAQNVARRLHVPEGRSTPTVARSRSPTQIARPQAADAVAPAKPSEKVAAPEIPSSKESPGVGPRPPSRPRTPRSPIPTLHVQPPSTDGLGLDITPPPGAFVPTGSSTQRDVQGPREATRHPREPVEGAPNASKVDPGSAVPDACAEDPPGEASPSKPH